MNKSKGFFFVVVLFFFANVEMVCYSCVILHSIDPSVTMILLTRVGGIKIPILNTVVQSCFPAQKKELIRWDFFLFLIVMRKSRLLLQLAITGRGRSQNHASRCIERKWKDPTRTAIVGSIMRLHPKPKECQLPFEKGGNTNDHFFSFSGKWECAPPFILL